MANVTATPAGSKPRSAEPPSGTSRLVRWLALAGLVGMTIWLGGTAAEHIRMGHPDFAYFYGAGETMLHTGAFDSGFEVENGRRVQRGSLDWYWPCVTRYMTLYALLPQRIAGYVWLTINVLALWVMLWWLGGHLSGLAPRDWPATQIVPLILLAGYWLWEFRLNQIDCLTLALMVGSFVCWQRGRGGVAGFWLGLAVLLKLTPGLLVVWFLLKRQTRTVAVAVLTVVLAGPVSDWAALGGERTVAAYREWGRKALASGSQRGLITAQREMDWRNQGLPAVLSRWLHPTDYNTHFDNDPQIQAKYAGLPPKLMNVANLPRTTVAGIALGITVLSLLGLAWLARHPAARLSVWQLRFEWALFVLAMLWLMPVMRRYHMIWAMPALSLLMAALRHTRFSGRWARLTLTCIGLALAAWLITLVRPLEPADSAWYSTSLLVEATGVLLASVALLGLPMIVMLVWLRRNPEALPAPPNTQSLATDSAAGDD